MEIDWEKNHAELKLMSFDLIIFIICIDEILLCQDLGLAPRKSRWFSFPAHMLFIFLFFNSSATRKENSIHIFCCRYLSIIVCCKHYNTLFLKHSAFFSWKVNRQHVLLCDTKRQEGRREVGKKGGKSNPFSLNACEMLVLRFLFTDFPSAKSTTSTMIVMFMTSQIYIKMTFVLYLAFASLAYFFISPWRTFLPQIVCMRSFEKPLSE